MELPSKISIILYILLMVGVTILAYEITLYNTIKDKAITFANIVLTKSYNCAYLNTVLANAYVNKHNQTCVWVLISKKNDHVRYIASNNNTIIDPSCGAECNNKTYIGFYICRDKNYLKVITKKYFYPKDFKNLTII